MSSAGNDGPADRAASFCSKTLASAVSMRSPASVPSRGAIAHPAAIRSGAGSVVARSTAARIRSTTIAASVSPRPGARMANSSPAVRAMTSWPRIVSRRIWAICTSARSPARWPCRAFTSRNSCTSRYMSANVPLARRACDSSSASRHPRSLRLASPVSGSVSARWLRARTSRETRTAPRWRKTRAAAGASRIEEDAERPSVSANARLSTSAAASPAKAGQVAKRVPPRAIQGPYASTPRPVAETARVALRSPNRYPAYCTTGEASYSTASPPTTPASMAAIAFQLWCAPQSSAPEYSPIAAPTARARCRTGSSKIRTARRVSAP